MKRIAAAAVVSIAIAGLASIAGVQGATSTRTTDRDEARIAAGKKLAAESCATDHCHGGSARAFEDMSGVTEGRIRKAIEEGVPDSGMSSFRGVFTPEQVDAVVAYVLAASGGTPSPAVAAHHVATAPHRSAPASLEAGVR